MSATAVPPTQARAAAIIVRHALREAARRRVLLVVAALTAAFLVIYALGAAFAFEEAGDFGEGFTDGLDDRELTGATLLGLAMFATLFLGAIVATFLTMGVVRGDAETGMLQPLVARPADRATILIARTAGAAAISLGYVVVVFALTVAITAATGDWTPDRPVGAGLLLGLAVVVVACISMLASVWLTSTAQGIAVLMIYGGGITAGLLGQIGDALGSGTLEDLSELTSWVLPFEAIYQAALYELTADTGGVTGFVLSLGPFGGARDGGADLLLWSIIYVAALLAIAIRGFHTRDL